MQIYLWILEIRLTLENNEKKKKKKKIMEFPGNLVVGTQRFCCWGLGSTPGWATEIPQAMWHGQNNNNNSNNIKTNNKCISEETQQERECETRARTSAVQMNMKNGS